MHFAPPFPDRSPGAAAPMFQAPAAVLFTSEAVEQCTEPAPQGGAGLLKRPEALPPQINGRVRKDLPTSPAPTYMTNPVDFMMAVSGFHVSIDQ
jgi:hypothetical protein